MSRLTDTQLVILSAASQRDDRGVELPANVKGQAARKLVDKLMRAGLLEEVGAAGSLPIWRRDDDSGPMALRITKNGLKAIDVEGDAVGAPKETSVRFLSAKGRRLFWRVLPDIDYVNRMAVRGLSQREQNEVKGWGAFGV